MIKSHFQKETGIKILKLNTEFCLFLIILMYCFFKKLNIINIFEESIIFKN
jgi:hypothetical protein